jgi:hypothetical protein
MRSNEDEFKPVRYLVDAVFDGDAGHGRSLERYAGGERYWPMSDLPISFGRLPVDDRNIGGRLQA